MSITVTGKVERQDFGLGVWALVTETGETYELMNPPTELTQPQEQVKVVGIIQENVMTIAMIGPVLEVTSFEKLA